MHLEEEEEEKKQNNFFFNCFFSAIERKFVFDLSQIAIKFYVMNFFKSTE